MYFNIVGDEIICIKEWELTLFDVKQNICVICDKLIQMVIEKKGDWIMLSRHETVNIILYERKRLVDIVDPVERKCVGAFIAGLECVLNE